MAQEKRAIMKSLNFEVSGKSFEFLLPERGVYQRNFLNTPKLRMIHDGFLMIILNCGVRKHVFNILRFLIPLNLCCIIDLVLS